MGAIFGYFGSLSEAEYHEMAKRLSHRGKETRFFRFDEHCALGGIEGASSTTFLDRDGYEIISDAVIYNTPELTRRIEKKGYAVSSGTATELILNLFVGEGVEGLKVIDGDYSFALWDKKNNSVFLGVDFLGCAPLYYTRLNSGNLVFASEYKALLAVDETVLEADRQMIQHLQCVKKLPSGKTLLKGIYSVPAGTVIAFDLDTASVKELIFPKLYLKVDIFKEEEGIDLLKKSLIDTVESRIGCFENFGIALSGGIDSIALACLSRRICPETNIHTFTAGYGTDDPEMVTAGRVAKSIGTEHHEVFTPSELLLSTLPEFVWHNEDPFARSESLQQYEIGRCARNYVDVLLSGQGADGLFAGMPKYRLLWYAHKYPMLRKPIEEFYNQSQYSLPARSTIAKVISLLYYKGRYKQPPRVIDTYYFPDEYKIYPEDTEFINRILIDGYQGGVSNSLHKFERNYSASGLFYTSPFYSRNLIETAFRITDTLKINAKSQKYILRRALRHFVPKDFLDVPKFPQRMNYDLKFSNILDDVSNQYLSRQRTEARGFFRYDEIQNLKRRKPGRAYAPETAMRIWTCMLTEIWAVEFLDKRGRGGFAQQSSKKRSGHVKQTA